MCEELYYSNLTPSVMARHASKSGLNITEIDATRTTAIAQARYPEPRPEIASFDQSRKIFKELARIKIPPGRDNPDYSWMLVLGKR